MILETGLAGRQFMGRFEHGSDLLLSLEDLVREQWVTAGQFFVIGAVQKARVAFYDQEKREYRTIELPKPLEILSCFGNVSLRNGKPVVHAHIVLSDAKGNTYGGHLVEGTILFAGEFNVVELTGINLERGIDEVTSLPLWQK